MPKSSFCLSNQLKKRYGSQQTIQELLPTTCRPAYRAGAQTKGGPCLSRRSWFALPFSASERLNAADLGGNGFGPFAKGKVAHFGTHEAIVALFETLQVIRSQPPGQTQTKNIQLRFLTPFMPKLLTPFPFIK
jgi:hypothetical protein